MKGGNITGVPKSRLNMQMSLLQLTVGCFRWQLASSILSTFMLVFGMRATGFRPAVQQKFNDTHRHML